jgi:hypothetical protein
MDACVPGIGSIITATRRSAPRVIFLALGLGLMTPRWGRAQDERFRMTAGGELEEYLRWLQSGGTISLYPWSIRGLSQRMQRRLLPTDSADPWSSRRWARAGADFRAVTLRPVATASYNSSFPWGYNDGPVWQGRGLTRTVQWGFGMSYGPVSLVVAPTAYLTENAGFELQDNGETGRRAYAHGRFPRNMDAPQRFGNEPYGAVDAGQSMLAVDLPFVSIGVSTANQFWGPATEHPIILGNNAAGFAHLFAGTSEPLDVGLGKIHGRLIWADLRQSSYSPTVAPGHRRFGTGLIGVVVPRGVPGLELGLARFFHEQWPDHGVRWRDLAKPFESFFRSALPENPDTPLQPNHSPDNQLASVFGRWVFPESEFELYAEYGREDHAWDLQELIQEPDHSGGFLLGIRKRVPDPRGFWGIRAEVLDLQVSQLILDRPETPFYRHGSTSQGHTHRGQILGSAFGTGGYVATLAVDRYHQRGRWGLKASRVLMQDDGRYWLTGVRNLRSFDVAYSLGADGLWFRSDLDVFGGVTLVYELNRAFRSDAANLHAFVGVRTAAGPRGARSRTVEHGPSDRQTGRGAAHTPARDAAPTADFVIIGDVAEDRLRLSQLTVAGPHVGYLLRSPSSLSTLPETSTPGVRADIVSPRIRLVWNSGLPFSLNQANLWAGAGTNASATLGVRATWGPLFAVAAPEISHSANRPFAMPDLNLAPLAGERQNGFANPWFVRPASIDLPLRFGEGSVSEIRPGQSTVGLRAGSLAVGLSTENQWWGPGIRNAIVLSNNAPGFPHVFLRTERPIQSVVGTFEGRWLTGGLSESDYFDSDGSNDLRSLSAVAGVWHPRWVPGLALGLSRAVYAPVKDWAGVAGAWLDGVARDPGRPEDRPAADSSRTTGPDQLYSVFLRWVFPDSRLELYGEWARLEFPTSLRDALEAPGHTRAYTLGLQWATPRDRDRGDLEAPSSTIRVQAEHTYLARSTTFRHRPVGTYYTSRAVPQGYTHEGRVLGAAVGPGAAAWWIALDHVSASWQVGFFGNWIRWMDDALWTVPRPGPSSRKRCMHDVSLLGGIRGAYAGKSGTVSAALAYGTRSNVHFRYYGVCGQDYDPDLATHIRNATLELRYSLPW